MDKTVLLAYLDGRRRPIAADPQAGAWHRTLLAAAPELYLDLLADTAADVSHRREVLANLLSQPGAGAARFDREAILERLYVQPVEDALQVLEAVHQGRCNGRRARGVGLAFLLGHERLAELAATRRTRLVRLLKHLLGERTWSTVVRCLRTGAVNDRQAPRRAGLLPPDLLARLLGRERSGSASAVDPEAFLHRTVLRYAKNPAAAREVLRFLADPGATPTPTPAPKLKPEPGDPILARRQAARRDLEQGQGLPRATLFGLRGTFHPEVPAARVRFLSAADPAQAAAYRDGPLTELFKRALTPGAEPLTGEAVSEQVAVAAEGMPVIDARMAVVLDLSGSAASSGERVNHPAGLGLALTALLCDRVGEVQLLQVGGSTRLNASALARPQGETDLATALLAGARGRPETILVISDGYENVRQGDTAAVAEGLRRLGLGSAVSQVVPLFTAGEDLGRRRLSEAIPVLAVKHEREVAEVLARVLLAHAPENLDDDDVDRLRRLLVRS
jgi:hypothetical protein